MLKKGVEPIHHSEQKIKKLTRLLQMMRTVEKMMLLTISQSEGVRVWMLMQLIVVLMVMLMVLVLVKAAPQVTR